MTKNYFLIRNSVEIRFALSSVSHTYVWSCILATSWSINPSCLIAAPITSSTFKTALLIELFAVLFVIDFSIVLCWFITYFIQMLTFDSLYLSHCLSRRCQQEIDLLLSFISIFFSVVFTVFTHYVSTWFYTFHYRSKIDSWRISKDEKHCRLQTHQALSRASKRWSKNCTKYHSDYTSSMLNIAMRWRS